MAEGLGSLSYLIKCALSWHIDYEPHHDLFLLIRNMGSSILSDNIRTGRTLLSSGTVRLRQRSLARRSSNFINSARLLTR